MHKTVLALMGLGYRGWLFFWYNLLRITECAYVSHVSVRSSIRIFCPPCASQFRILTWQSLFQTIRMDELDIARLMGPTVTWIISIDFFIWETQKNFLYETPVPSNHWPHRKIHDHYCTESVVICITTTTIMYRRSHSLSVIHMYQ